MKRLTGRRLTIALGLADLPLETVTAYRAHWQAQGYDVPPLGADRAAYLARWRGLGDAIAWLLSACGVHPWEGCGCAARRQWLNSAVPFPIHWPMSIPFVP